MHVLLNGVTEIFEGLLQLLSFLGLFKFFSELFGAGSLPSLAEVVEGNFVVLSPVRLLECFKFLFDIVGLILDDLNGLVVNMETILSLSNMLFKSLVEIFNLFSKLLSFRTISEFLIKLVNCLGLLCVCKIIESLT